MSHFLIHGILWAACLAALDIGAGARFALSSLEPVRRAAGGTP
jgi:hypothetical protein